MLAHLCYGSRIWETFGTVFAILWIFSLYQFFSRLIFDLECLCVPFLNDFLNSHSKKWLWKFFSHSKIIYRSKLHTVTHKKLHTKLLSNVQTVFFIKSGILFNIFYCPCMFVNKHFTFHILRAQISESKMR